MDVALCTINNTVYDIAGFEALDEGCVSIMRRNLLCPRCLGPGFYRKAARSGQASCFGARPHADFCDMGGPQSSSYRGDTLEEDDVVNRGECIEVDFAFGAPLRNHVNEEGAVFASGTGRQGSGQAGARTQTRQRRLSTLLKNLILSDDFRRSEQLISVQSGVFKVRDFFVPFACAEVDELDRMRGYWGLVSDAAQSGDQPPSLWLNTGGRQDLSVVVDSSLTDDFTQRFPIQELEDLAGAYVLVFGYLRVSKNAKKYIAVSDISRITLNKTP
jgi:hypothetical protein